MEEDKKARAAEVSDAQESDTMKMICDLAKSEGAWLNIRLPKGHLYTQRKPFLRSKRLTVFMEFVFGEPGFIISHLSCYMAEGDYT